MRNARKKLIRFRIYLGKREVEIKELPLPKISENDVLIKNIFLSICGTDTAVYLHGPGIGHKVAVGGEFSCKIPVQNQPL